VKRTILGHYRSSRGQVPPPLRATRWNGLGAESLGAGEILLTSWIARELGRLGLAFVRKRGAGRDIPVIAQAVRERSPHLGKVVTCIRVGRGRREHGGVSEEKVWVCWSIFPAPPKSQRRLQADA